MNTLPPDIMMCVQQSSQKYELPVELLLAVIKTEGGRNGLRIKNRNGSWDLGIMQINSVHLPALKKMGIDKHMLLYNSCVNIDVGAWMLRSNFPTSPSAANKKEWWRYVGNYHSKTPTYNVEYQKLVWKNLQKQ